MPSLACFAALSAALSAAAGPATTRYDFLSGGKVVGALVRSAAPEGTIRVEFAYTENGRGPKLVETYRLDRRQVVAHAVTGVNTLGAKVDERFARDGTAATWKTTSDEGRADAVTGAAAYAPLVGTPESLALAVRLALAHHGTLRLLPAGNLRVEKVRSLTVQGPAGRKTIALYAARGILFAPAFIWLDADGALFSDVGESDPPFGTIREGYAAEAPRLAAAMKDAQGALLVALARKVRHPVDPPLAVTNVRVFDPVVGALGAPSTVYFFRGRVASVVPAAEKVPADVAVVDGAGGTLLPGLIDMHDHEWSWNAALQIAGGVTTARDVGNTDRELLELEDKADRGDWVGPRLWRAGFIEGDSPFAARSGGQVAATLEEALAWVDRHARRGYRGVKLYNSIKPEWMAPLAERAKLRGLRVSGHIPAFARARDAILAGYQEVHHVNQLLLNFVMKDGEDTRTIARFVTVADRACDLDLDGAEFKDFVQLMKDRGVAHDPTLTVFEDMFTQAQGELSASYGMIEDHLPATIRRQLRLAAFDVDARTRERYRASFRKALAVVKRLDDAGVTLVPGTDSVAGFTLHREYELWVKAGIPAARVLQHATLGSARVLGWEHELGRLAPGLYADAVLVDGDPTQEISAVRRVAMVVKQGDVYFPAEIYRELGVKPFVDPPALRLPVTKSDAGGAAGRHGDDAHR
jgi:hypothetical protein